MNENQFQLYELGPLLKSYLYACYHCPNIITGLLVNSQAEAKIIRDHIMKLHLAAGWMGTTTDRIAVNHIYFVNGSRIYILSNPTHTRGIKYNAFSFLTSLDNLEDAMYSIVPNISNRKFITKFNL